MIRSCVLIWICPKDRLVVVVVVVVVVLTLTPIIKSVVTGQAPVTLIFIFATTLSRRDYFVFFPAVSVLYFGKNLNTSTPQKKLAS